MTYTVTLVTAEGIAYAVLRHIAPAAAWDIAADRLDRGRYVDIRPEPSDPRAADITAP